MFSAERRMQEGSRDLALAFMIGRTEEALSRLSVGAPISDKERTYFEQVLHLFADALDAFSWASGKAAAPPPAGALRALRLVIPAVREQAGQENPEQWLNKLTDTARELASSHDVNDQARATLTSVLRRVATYAGGQGREALESPLPASGVPALTNRAL